MVLFIFSGTAILCILNIFSANKIILCLFGDHSNNGFEVARERGERGGGEQKVKKSPV